MLQDCLIFAYFAFGNKVNTHCYKNPIPATAMTGVVRKTFLLRQR